MRGPCATSTNLDKNDSPYDTKWYNCLYESEPLPLRSKQGLDDLKKLCAPLYENDDTPVCCNAEQLTILKKDILAAETVLGTCASCYFNFRMLWCQSTCSPNQSEFIVPRTIETREKMNFTQILDTHNLQKLNEKKKQREKPTKCDEEEEEQEREEEEKEHNSDENKTNAHIEDNESTTHAVETEPITHGVSHQSSEEPQNVNQEHEIKKRNANDDQKFVKIVLDLEYHISYEFLHNLVESCR